MIRRRLPLPPPSSTVWVVINGGGSWSPEPDDIEMCASDIYSRRACRVRAERAIRDLLEQVDEIGGGDAPSVLVYILDGHRPFGCYDDPYPIAEAVIGPRGGLQFRDV